VEVDEEMQGAPRKGEEWILITKAFKSQLDSLIIEG